MIELVGALRVIAYSVSIPVFMFLSMKLLNNGYRALAPLFFLLSTAVGVQQARLVVEAYGIQSPLLIWLHSIVWLAIAAVGVWACWRQLTGHSKVSL